MAEKKPAKSRKTAVKKAAIVKKKSTMRESAAKTRASQSKPKRVRKAAEAVSKPVSATGAALTQEFHLFERKEGGNFYTKSRKLSPAFMRNSWLEIKQVTWPGRRETWRLVFSVFLFAIAMGTIIAVLDYGLEKVLREIIL
ncbi:MAG: preprotein translocase SecE subunit [Candidatus Saccharimonadales bacterium]